MHGPDGHIHTGQWMVRKIVTKMNSHFIFFLTNSNPHERASGQRPPDMTVWKGGHRGSDPSNPQQVVQFGGRRSTSELLTYFCYIFTILGVVTFTICFSL
jgi:hypothetical protein